MAEEKDGVKSPEGGSEKAPLAEVEKKVPEASKEPVRDYRKELEDERAKRVKAEEERENYKSAALAAKRKLKDGGDDFGGEEIDPDAQADAIAERVMQRLAPSIARNNVDQAIAAYTSDPDKQALIKYHYENSLAKSGIDAASVQDDIEKAVAIADAPRLRIERDEAARAAAAHKTPSLGGSGYVPEPEDKTQHVGGWTPSQITAIQERHTAATGKPMTEAELKKAWDLAKSGSAGAERPK